MLFIEHWEEKIVTQSSLLARKEFEEKAKKKLAKADEKKNLLAHGHYKE